MAKDDLIFNNPEIKDYRTDYGKGLEPKIDPRTDYGKGLEPKIDPRTDFGKGIYYKSIDGREHASMASVEQANNAYWDSMMIDTSHKDYVRYAELEKAYFDCITPKFNINDKDMIQQVLTAQQEKFVTYIEERYLKYLSELLEQYGYGQQDNNRGPKR